MHVSFNNFNYNVTKSIKNTLILIKQCDGLDKEKKCEGLLVLTILIKF